MTETSGLRDVATEPDLITLMRAFYDRATIDPILGPKFEGVDIEAHIPVIVEFWKGIVVGGSNYRGSPPQAHAHLELEKQHFEVWIPLFHRTVDDLFAGENAETLKSRAVAIGGILQHSLGIR